MKSQLRQKMLLSVLTTLVASLVGSASCLAWSLASQPIEGVLLLKNSNILRGKIQKQGEHYHVYLANGKLQIRQQQVETVCENIEAAYQFRRQQRAGSSADSHLELAGWCLRQDLYARAEQELEAAEAIDSTHPRLGLLQRQWKQAVHMAQVRATQELAETTVVVEPEPLDPATLEKAPKWARALFVRQIQPLMVHSCATGGCHQRSEESKFQLNRLALDGVGHPGVTLRNLAGTLEQIDWSDGNNSDLLTRARQAHGGENASEPLPPHKLQVLQTWVGQLTESHRRDNELKSLPMVAEVEPEPTTPTLQLNAPQQTVSMPQAQPPEGVRMASYEPADPFDPSVFNNRYETSKESASASSSTADSVPHVLAPSEEVPIPLPATE